MNEEELNKVEADIKRALDKPEDSRPAKDLLDDLTKAAKKDDKK